MYASKVGPILNGRQSVIIGNEKEALSLVLQGDVVLDGAKVVSQVEFAGRLHAAEDAFAFGSLRSRCRDHKRGSRTN